MQNIKYRIDRGKRKNVYIRIENGEVIVKVPKRMPEQAIERILQEKSEWIYEKLKISQEKMAKETKKYINGEYFTIIGKKYQLQISYEPIRQATIKVESYKIYMALPKRFEEKTNEEKTKEIQKQIERLYFAVAQREVKIAMDEITKKVGLYPNEYRVRKLKRAWGNCSSTKNITINVNIAKQSMQAIKYVVLHEICHLKYMNHSKDFWKMVEKYMPDYKLAETELKNA